MTFEEICASDSRVLEVYDSIKPDPDNWHAWSEIKQRLSELVGWDRREPPESLATSDAYDTVYRACLARHEGV